MCEILLPVLSFALLLDLNTQRSNWFHRLLTEIIDDESLNTLKHIVPKVELILLAVINVSVSLK